jgi:hypothetical protein
MTQTGYQSPNNRIVMGGSPLIQELKVETATGCVPGALVTRGTNDDDLKVADGLGAVIGWLGYEQANPAFMPSDIDTAYAANDQAPVISGAGNLIFMPAGLAAGTVAKKRDLLLSWASGKVVPCASFGGRLAIKIPFTKNTSETDTGVDLPGGILITGWRVDVTTAASSGTIDFGILSTESGGDADGFCDGASCAATGLVFPGNVDATDTANTSGALLVEADIKSADSTALYYSVPVPYKTDGTAKSISYTTSNHTIAGDIYLFVESPGIGVVGKAEKSVSAASAAADIQVRSLI